MKVSYVALLVYPKAADEEEHHEMSGANSL